MEYLIYLSVTLNLLAAGYVLVGIIRYISRPK